MNKQNMYKVDNLNWWNCCEFNILIEIHIEKLNMSELKK